MARKASSKPDSGSSSTATIGFEADSRSFGIRHSSFIISPASGMAHVSQFEPNTASTLPSFP